jgi:hypothetical protein
MFVNLTSIVKKRRLEFPPDGWSKQELVDVDG